MKIYLPILSILMITQIPAFSQATHPYVSCPDVNIAIVRAGTNADITNPYFLYNVNQGTGVMTLVPGGPYKDPANPVANLQVNGIGVNRRDGYIYGLVFDGTPTTARFVRMDSTYGVTELGQIPSPISATGVLGIINPAAGDMDTSGNFYFSAFTANPTPTPAFDKFFIGRISNTQSLVTGPATVEYFEVNVNGANCGAYVASLSNDPNNSGLKDFSYHAGTNTFFTYATYKPAGAANFSGQLLQLTPVAGSSPLRYQLSCSPVVNTHNAETSGTIIDKSGKFTVLFTDGSFGELQRDAGGAYTGVFTMINPATGLPNPLRGDMGSCGVSRDVIAPGPLGFDCPENYAVVRAGMNADITNPYSLYTVNGVTGALTLIPGGPLYYPGGNTTLQLNGIGVNKSDGMIYGMAFEGSFNTARFVKTDKAYNVTLMGNIPPPVNANGTPGFVNSAAGDIFNNAYYFTAATTKPGGPNGIMIDKLWLGKISDISSVAGVPAPVYYEVDWQGSPCNEFISSLNNDPINSGIKDLFYHPVTRTFFTYATYKLSGDNQYRGQMIELKPTGGPNSPNSYKMHCKNVINMHDGETSGTMVTNEGTFMILMTDGTVGRIPRTGSSFNYSGDYEVVNNATGLPAVIRADLASCTNLEHPSTNPGPGGGRPVVHFSLGPNPTQFNQDVILRWTDMPRPVVVNITVSDSYGNIVRRMSNVMATQGAQMPINVVNLAAGVYHVTVYATNGKEVSKLKFVKVN